MLDLHRKSYGLLLWIARQAERGSAPFSADAAKELQYGEQCEAWVRRHRHNLPSEFQPAEYEVKPFALLLASFLRTSFHVEELSGEDGSRAVLRHGAAAHEYGRAAKRRDRKTTRELQIIALKCLAEEAGLCCTHDQISGIVDAEPLASDVGLWSYAFELHRRSQFSSQGPAVHRMWLDMSTADRRKLKAKAVWSARERLIKVMRAGSEKGV